MKKSIFLFFLILYFTSYLYCKSAGKSAATNVVQVSTAAFTEDQFSETEEMDEEGAPVIEATQDAEGEDIKKQFSAEPLNLNTATISELLDLPGITSRLARKILRQRKKQPFFDVDDLKRVSGMKPEIFERIKPFVKVEIVELKAGEVLKGDMRFRFRATRPLKLTADGYFDNDSSSSYPGHYYEPFYFYNRTRIKYGYKHEFGWVAFRRDMEPEITIRNFRQYSIKKYWIRMNDVFYFDKVILGNYNLRLNQGLAFYHYLSEAVRPIKIKDRGAREDKSTNSNEHLKGIVIEKRFSSFDTLFFVSDKFLDTIQINPDGTANVWLGYYRGFEGGGYVQTTNQRRSYKTVREKVVGGRIKYYIPFMQDTSISALSYSAKYSPELNVIEDLGVFIFRGDEIKLYDFAFDTYYKNLNFFGEYAKTDGFGQSWLLQQVLKIPPVTLWSGVYNYDRDYYNRFGKAKAATSSIKGVEKLGVKEVRSQKGFFTGIQYKKKAHKIQLSATVFNMPAFRPISYSGTSTMPIGPYDGMDIYMDYKYKILRNMELQLREWEIYSVVRAIPDGGENPSSSNKTLGDAHDFARVVKKTRLQLKWNATKNTRYSVRYEQRITEIEDVNRTTIGKMVFGEVKHKLSPALTLNTRMIFFDAPDEYITQSEPYWKNVYVTWTTSLMRNPSKGSRYYIQLVHKFSRKSSIWLKYEHTIRDRGTKGAEEYGKRDHMFKLQYDVKW